MAYADNNCTAQRFVSDTALEDAISEIGGKILRRRVITPGWAGDPIAVGDLILLERVYDKPVIFGPIQRYCRRTSAMAAVMFEVSWSVQQWMAFEPLFNGTFRLGYRNFVFMAEFKLCAHRGNGTFTLEPVSTVPVFLGEPTLELHSDAPPCVDTIFGLIAHLLFSLFQNEAMTSFVKYNALHLLGVAAEEARTFSF